jgi:hypothetical protein
LNATQEWADPAGWKQQPSAILEEDEYAADTLHPTHSHMEFNGMGFLSGLLDEHEI